MLQRFAFLLREREHVPQRYDPETLSLTEETMASLNCWYAENHYEDVRLTRLLQTVNVPDGLLGP